MTNMFRKSFEDADEVKTPDKTHASVVKLGNVNVTKLVLQPGWKWSECVKPVVGGDSCQAGHVGVIIQGKLMCVHDDGSEVLAEAGDAYYFAPGHDGWVVGDEPVIGYEFAETGKDFGPGKQPVDGGFPDFPHLLARADQVLPGARRDHEDDVSRPWASPP